MYPVAPESYAALRTAVPRLEFRAGLDYQIGGFRLPWVRSPHRLTGHPLYAVVPRGRLASDTPPRALSVPAANVPCLFDQ